MPHRSSNGRLSDSFGDHNDARAADERPLLRSFPNPSGYGVHHITGKDEVVPITTKVKQHLTSNVSTRWADLILLVCFFVSGTIDAGAYNAYENFASMQTGNTIFAALGVSNLPVSSPRLAWTKSVCSILSYLLGALVIATFHRTFGEKRRWVLTFSFTLQAVFIAIAAILVDSGRSSGSPPSKGDPSLLTVPADPGFPWSDLIPIAPLSFQAAGKVIASRMLQYNGMPCIVLTTLYADLISDPGLFSARLGSNVQRNRRAGGAVLYFVGAVIGGVAASSSVGFSGGLCIAAAIHVVLAGAWMMWRSEEDDKSDEEG